MVWGEVIKALPILSDSIRVTTTAYALRVSLDKKTAFNEVHSVIDSPGKFLLVYIGKPDTIYKD